LLFLISVLTILCFALAFFLYRQKTVKSTAEMEVELNANYAFDAITEAGAQLEPMAGPGLQGLQNLGNSCYMNSIVQLLLSGTAIPELANRYGVPGGGSGNNTSLTQHALLKRVETKQASEDLLCQTAKVACALTSGVFCKPAEVLALETTADTTGSSNDPKYRLAPRMLKHVVGKDHVDFCTGQQQDAAQFLQYFLERLDRAEQGAAAVLKKSDDAPLHVASHIFSFQTTSRMVCSGDQRVKYKESAPETVWSLRVPMDKATVIAVAGDDVPDQKRFKPEEQKEEKKPIPTIAFQACLEEWAAETQVDGIRWGHLQNSVHVATEHTRLTNFPRYLIIQIQRYQLGPDWTPIKLEVNLDIPEDIDLTAFKSTGPVEGENLIPDEETGPAQEAAGATSAAAPAISFDEGAVSQLMDMGFSLNSCKRALMAVGGSDVEAAMGWVFEHNMDPDFNDPLPEPSTQGGAPAAGAPSDAGTVVDEGVVQSLVDNLGCFTADHVRAALKETSGAADRAADWLFSHMDDLDGAIAALESKNQSQQANTTSGPKVPLEDGEGKYTMVGLVSHIGKNTGSGHYVAHLKKDGKWVIFNDEKVALSHQPPIQHAYMYLFQRTDSVGSPNPNY
jgi:ubiquitin carboxyl-terminal hydrolase 5/13